MKEIAKYKDELNSWRADGGVTPGGAESAPGSWLRLAEGQTLTWER